MNIKFSEWKSCTKEPPTKDGYYAVARINVESNTICLLSYIEYSCKWGWNASEEYHDSVIVFTDEDVTNIWSEITCTEGE